MAEPIETFIGWSAVGVGTILVYAAVKNKRPFHDIIRPALASGTILGNKPAALPTAPPGNPALVPFGGATAVGSQAGTATPPVPFGGATAVGSQAGTAGA